MRKLTLWLALLWAGLLAVPSIQAQQLDPSFTPTVTKGGFIFGVRALAQQPDGKALVAGDFSFAGGVLTNRVLRLNTNGTRDLSFQSTVGANSMIDALALQPDGKILIGGTPTGYNGASTAPVLRLNPDGSPDASFAVPASLGLVGQALALALQPDGKILVAGYFSGSASQTARANVLRLNANGSPDATFNAGNGTSGGTVFTVLIQADGKIMLGGAFRIFNGVQVSNLVRLNADGSLDATFNAGTGPNGLVRTLAQQPDGNLLVGGSFSQFSGQSLRRLVRLLPSGALDNSFVTGASFDGGVTRVRLRSNGQLLVTGAFTRYDGQVCGGVARLNASGTRDNTFGNTSTNPVFGYDVLEVTGGQVLTGYRSTTYPDASNNPQNIAYLARLTPAGQLDPSFNLNLEAQGNITSLTILNSGKLLVQGDFASFNGTPVINYGLMRLNTNGTVDTEIVPAAIVASSGYYSRFFPQPDGRIYATLEDYSGAQVGYSLVRLMADGSLDATFQSPLFDNANNYVTLKQVLPQANGTVVVTGDFETVDGTSRLQLARLQATGTLDAGFNTNPFWNGQGDLVQVLPEAGGTFIVEWTQTTSPAPFYYGLKRIDTGGNVSATFQNNAVFTGSPVDFNVVQQPNGQLVVSGNFITYNGTSTPNGIVRLTAGGQVDASLNPALPGQVLLVQPDGRLLLKTAPHEVACALKRLNANGSLDTSFGAVAIPETHYFDSIYNAVLQPTDAKILLYGSFTTVAGQQRISLARLNNTLLGTTNPAVAEVLSLYPNPAHATAELTLAAHPLATTAQVLDATGRVLREQAVAAQARLVRLDLSGLPAGLYLVRCGGTAQRLLVD